MTKKKKTKNPFRFLKSSWLWFTILFFLIAILSNQITEAKPAAEVTILCYHSFFGNKKYQTDFSLDELRKHIEILRKRGYRFVDFEEVQNGLLTGDKNILFTIDDGNKSAFKAYQEVFKPENIKPLFAIYTYAIGRFPFMTWEQVHILSADGCEIASHGYKHRPLTDSRLAAHPDQILEELLLSIKMLEENIGKPVRVFVYPYGQFGKLTEQLVGMSGYETAFSLTHGKTHIPLDKNADRLLLPRYMLTQANAKRILSGM